MGTEGPDARDFVDAYASPQPAFEPTPGLNSKYEARISKQFLNTNFQNIKKLSLN